MAKICIGQGNAGFKPSEGGLYLADGARKALEEGRLSKK